MADKRPNAYFEDDVLILRASALGGCERALVQVGMGIEGEPPPADIQKRWAQGNVAEPLILDALRAKGWKLLGQDEYPQVAWDETGQPAVEIAVGSKIKIRCHPDGIGQCYKGHASDADMAYPTWFVKGDRRVVECKALRPSFPRDFPAYLWQMSVEMHATGLKGLWAYGNKNAEGIVESFEFKPQDEAPYSLKEIKQRALKIYRAINDREIPVCDTKQFPCPFYTDPDASCSREQKAAGKAEVAQAPASLRLLAEPWLKAKKAADEANQLLAETRARLLAKLEEEGLTGEAYQAPGVVLRQVKGKKGGIDLTKLKAAGIDVDTYRKPDTKGYWEVRLDEGGEE